MDESGWISFIVHEKVMIFEFPQMWIGPSRLKCE
jgi:hypothetical protein